MHRFQRHHLPDRRCCIVSCRRLTAYLQQEKVAVNAVVVHVPAAAGADVRGSSGSGMGNAGGEISQRSGEGENNGV